ncbi:hypothetical protein AAEO50_16420, partial [Rossellomorea oryzaecorticis]
SLCETPQERTRRGGSRATRGKRSLARKSIAVFRAYSIMSSLDIGVYFPNFFLLKWAVILLIL